MKKIKVIIMLLVFLVASTAHGAVYYVNGVSGDDENPGTIGQPWKTIHKANVTLQAGDTVYIRGGTYNVGSSLNWDGSTATQGINPSNSGTSMDARITYSVYPGEVVTLQAIHDRDPVTYSRGIYIDGKDYIHVTGYNPSDPDARNLILKEMREPIQVRGTCGAATSEYNEIDHVEAVGPQLDYTYQGSAISHCASYNYFHHNTIHEMGFYSTSLDGGAGFEIGMENEWDTTNNNVLENNHFYHGGHHCLGIFGRNNVVRNNKIHNDRWYYYEPRDKYYGYRAMYLASFATQYDLHKQNVIENNSIHHSGISVRSASGVSLVMLSQPENIVRYNQFFAGGLVGIFINVKPTEINNKNHIYNNTFFANGYGESTYNIGGVFRGGICIYKREDEGERLQYHVIKNNLFYKNQRAYSGKGSSIAVVDPDGDAYVTVENNWDDYYEEGDPCFINEGPYSDPSLSDPYFEASDPLSTTVPDLRLQATSPCIDAGGHLTTASNSGSSSTNLTVNDALYFQDGVFGQERTAWHDYVNLHADWIAIGTVSNVVQIRSINYDTNTITLASPRTWGKGDRVWLYKKSDGKVILRGTAPEMGAHEYMFISPPDNIRAGSN